MAGASIGPVMQVTRTVSKGVSLMRRLSLLIPIAMVVVFALASAAAAIRPAAPTQQTPKRTIATANVAPRVELRPAVVRVR